MNARLKAAGMWLVKAALGALGAFGIYAALRVLDGDFDISNVVGLLLMVGAVGAFTYAISVRTNDASHNAKWAAETAGNAAVDANRAAMDARRMLDVLADYWQQMREQQPPTEPHPVVGPDTVPESEAVARIADVELAYEFARIEDILHRPMRTIRTRKRGAAA